jgi:thioredoxin reductase (NADPH)
VTVHDVLIVGAGPSGLATAIAARARGLDYLIVERGVLVNSIFHFPVHMVFFTTPELLEIGNIPMTSLGDKPTRTEGLKYYRRVAEHYRLDVHQYESVLGVDGEPGRFTIESRDRFGANQVYTAERVILATGFYDIPNLLNCPGESLPKVTHYYAEAHPYWNMDVAIVGAKNSAAIAALELFWTGARVTMIHRGPAISDSVKYWIKPNIENRIKSGEVKAYFRSGMKEIRTADIVISTPEGDVTVANDFVLSMTGYRPDLNFLGSMGITLQPDTLRPLTRPETLESERKGIYLAGVIVAGMHTNEIFIENGRFHGAKIAEAIAAELG